MKAFVLASNNGASAKLHADKQCDRCLTITIFRKHYTRVGHMTFVKRLAEYAIWQAGKLRAES